MPYVNLNASLRAAAKNPFEEKLYKFFVNSVFGKSMENVRNRMEAVVVFDHAHMKKLASKPYLALTSVWKNLY